MGLKYDGQEYYILCDLCLSMSIPVSTVEDAKRLAIRSGWREDRYQTKVGPLSRWYCDNCVEQVHNTFDVGFEALRQELAECQQRNENFSRCARRALELWQEKHPDSEMWPDAAKNLCWLAEEVERLRTDCESYRAALVQIAHHKCRPSQWHLSHRNDPEGYSEFAEHVARSVLESEKGPLGSLPPLD